MLWRSANTISLASAGPAATAGLVGNFTIIPDQFAPTVNIESLAPVMYMAFETAISGITAQQNSNSFNNLITQLSLNTTQAATLTQMQTVFSEMINAVGNNNIYPLLQLSGLYDLLNNDPSDASGGAHYGMDIGFTGTVGQSILGGICGFLPSLASIAVYMSNSQPFYCAGTITNENDRGHVFTVCSTGWTSLAASYGFSLSFHTPSDFQNSLNAGGSGAPYYTQLNQLYNLYSQCNEYINTPGIPSYYTVELAIYNNCLQNIQGQITSIQNSMNGIFDCTPCGQQYQQAGGPAYNQSWDTLPTCKIMVLRYNYEAYYLTECIAWSNQLVSLEAQLAQLPSCVAPSQPASVTKACFDYADFIASYPNVSISSPSGSQIPSLYQQLLNGFAPAYTEETYSIGLSQALQMDITAQSNGMAAQLSTQASLSFLSGIYTQVQQVNSNLNNIEATLLNIDQQLVMVNKELVNVEGTLQQIQSSVAALAAGGGGGTSLDDAINAGFQLAEIF